MNSFLPDRLRYGRAVGVSPDTKLKDSFKGLKVRYVVLSSLSQIPEYIARGITTRGVRRVK